MSVGNGGIHQALGLCKEGMMDEKKTYNVNGENIARICMQTLHDLSGNFDPVECVMGLSEAIGRIIVDTAKTPIQGREMLDVSQAHIGKVMEIGFRLRGFGG